MSDHEPTEAEAQEAAENGAAEQQERELTTTERIKAFGIDFGDPIETAQRQEVNQAAANVRDFQYKLEHAQRVHASHEIRLLGLLTDKAEAKKRAAEAKQRAEERAKERILADLARLSPEVIAEHLAKKGIKHAGPADVSARTVLLEARDTIQATYWIRSEEIKGGGVYDPLDLQKINLPDKHLELPMREGRTAVVTGMCSIGALAVARLLIDDEYSETHTGVPAYTTLEERDFHTRKAGAALARVIREAMADVADDHDLGGTNGISRSPADIIARWNDTVAEGRDDILDMFDQALDSPLLEATEIWTVGLRHSEDGGGFLSKVPGLSLTETEARELVSHAGDSELPRDLELLLAYVGIPKTRLNEGYSFEAVLSYAE